MRPIFIIIALFAISACTNFSEDKEAVKAQAKIDAKTVSDKVETNTMRVANNIRDGVRRTGERVRSWWLTPLPNPQKHDIPNRYCYRVMQDILCYREQMIGWENKLVGYQGTNAVTPNPATMQPIDMQPETDNNLPANRIVNAKPVFIKMPTETKEQKEIITDDAHEELPISPLAPQI